MDADAEKVARLRELLPATGAGIYLDTATFGPLPTETAAAMREADDWEVAVGRIWPGRSHDVEQRAEEARAVLAALLGGDPRQLVLAHSRDDAYEKARRYDLPGEGRLLDITNRAGVVPISLEKLGADGLVLACDRWLLGPEGTWALWLSESVGTRAQRPDNDVPRTALIGLARSVGWLEMHVGLEWIFDRTARLVRRLYDLLAGQPGCEVLTQSDTLFGILAFRLAEWRAAAAVDELSARVHALVHAMPDLNAIRVSVAWFNTEDELDRFAAAVSELASHTPDTLPPRPRIELL
jgi:selenocysteine lyase/cysteine desulfurase